MPRQSSVVLFQVPARGVRRRAIRAFARTLEFEVARGGSFCALISSDRCLRQLNRDFRRRDYPTDVLSFPASDGSGFAGELAISADRALAQASQHGHSLEDEIRILMLHGVLHLAGMDHQRDGGKMERAERRWRKRFQLPPGLIERVRA